MLLLCVLYFFFFKQKTAYEMRISDWSSDVCSSDLGEDPDAAWSLPAWTYRDPEFFDLERRRIFRPSWQIVAHESDIPAPGDFRLLDYIGESVILMRGGDGLVRAFAHVCRHRGARTSEERRVGKKCGRTCRFRWSPYH